MVGTQVPAGAAFRETKTRGGRKPSAGLQYTLFFISICSQKILVRSDVSIYQDTSARRMRTELEVVNVISLTKKFDYVILISHVDTIRDIFHGHAAEIQEWIE